MTINWCIIGLHLVSPIIGNCTVRLRVNWAPTLFICSFVLCHFLRNTTPLDQIANMGDFSSARQLPTDRHNEREKEEDQTVKTEPEQNLTSMSLKWKNCWISDHSVKAVNSIVRAWPPVYVVSAQAMAPKSDSGGPLRQQQTRNRKWCICNGALLPSSLHLV